MKWTTRVWNASPGSISRGIRRRLDERRFKPGWATVQDGVLKGAELYVPQGGRVWEEMIEGHYDEALLDALRSKYKLEGAVFWDIGAHVGYHSLALAALGAEVLAFEPNAANLERLRINLARNARLAPRIQNLAVAVSDADGEMSFRQSDDLRGPSTGGHLESALPPLKAESYAAFKKVTVPTARIDTLVKAPGRRAPGFIKIDVEGAEEMVLKGGAGFLSRARPVLLMEIHHICLMFSIQKLLLGWGYQTRILDETHATPSRCFIIAEN